MAFHMNNLFDSPYGNGLSLIWTHEECIRINLYIRLYISQLRIISKRRRRNKAFLKNIQKCNYMLLVLMVKLLFDYIDEVKT